MMSCNPADSGRELNLFRPRCWKMNWYGGVNEVVVRCQSADEGPGAARIMAADRSNRR